MEILKRGYLPAERVAVWECYNCKSQIRSKMSEGERVYDQKNGDYISNICPVCSNPHSIAVKVYRDPADKVDTCRD